MNHWLFHIGLMHYLVLSALLFSIGAFVMMTKRNAIGILIGVELVLNSVNINLIAFGRYRGYEDLEGMVTALFVIVLAAAEAAVAVAICVNFYKNVSSVDVDQGDLLHG
jgi:NADH-quinone oxidoreductase subunit K